MSFKRPCAAVILAAGKGVRMKSDLPKVLHPLMGKPLVTWVARACRKAGVERVVLVIGHQADQVRETLGPDFEYAEQKPQLGTGHALMTAARQLKDFTGDLLVLVGDAPFLSAAVLKKLIRKHQTVSAAATLMTVILDPPPAYGRIVRDEQRRVLRIVEERDATSAEKRITEVNTSHYCFDAQTVLPLLASLSTDNDQGEYYLTDVIGLLSRNGKRLETLSVADPVTLMGINSRSDLAEAHVLITRHIVKKHMHSGVSFPNPEGVLIEPEVRIGPDTVILPGTLLSGSTVIGRNCVIGPHTTCRSARIGDGCRIEHAVIEDRRVPSGSTVGPFAFLSGE